MTNNKTEYANYNEDDYVERKGELHEITVEITLCEYRNLIEERCRNEKAIETLQSEKENLKKMNEILTKIVYEKSPELRETVDLLLNTYGKEIFASLTEHR